MKKNSILIAVFAVIAAATVAKAENLSLDFDKGSFSTEKFMEAINAQEVNQTELPARVFSVEPVGAGDSQADYAIKATIKECEKNKTDKALTGNLKKLLLHGTTEEKAKFITSEKYTFPKRLNMFIPDRSFDQATMTNKAVYDCAEWGTKQVCRDKEVWQTACVAGTVWCFVAAGGSCGPAGAVCTLVNRVISECVPVPYCIKWDDNPIPGTGNPGVAF